MKNGAAAIDVLLVDDDVSLREALAEEMPRSGFQMTAVPDGESALQLAENLGHLIRVAGRIHLLEDVGHSTGRIDHERRAGHAHPLHAERVLLDPDTIGLGDRVSVVHEQALLKAVLRLELPV